jgi:hypothetical protein
MSKGSIREYEHVKEEGYQNSEIVKQRPFKSMVLTTMNRERKDAIRIGRHGEWCVIRANRRRMEWCWEKVVRDMMISGNIQTGKQDGEYLDRRF